MKRTVQGIIAALVLLSIISCVREDEYDKYARPDWLAGKVFTQISEDPDLSTFAACIRRIGYDTIIDRSGSYTIFAPDNAAFDLYFQGNPDYSSIDDIPLTELDRIVKYHIVQNPWSKIQLTSLDVKGWIDSTDITNDKPRGYKRQTLLLEKEFKFGVIKDARDIYALTDTLEASWHRKIVKDSRKFAPIFFREYFDIYDLKSSDYEFYFNRPFESNDDLYFAGAKVLEDEVFAENGFIYKIDRVVEPLKNAHQFLSAAYQGESYTDFLNLIYKFPEFDFNEQKTNEQTGVELGLDVDSLFDISFPELAFNIINEKTKAPAGTLGLPREVSIRYHHGLLAPSNAAFAGLIEKYLDIPNGWRTIKDAPRNIQRIIANTHLSQNPVYETDLQNGFYNGEVDLVTLDESAIIRREYGSNVTFIGRDEAIVPRAFSAVTGPVYLQKGYTFSMYAIERAGLLSALKRPDEHYSFFVESDFYCGQDSSLIYDIGKERFQAWQNVGIPHAARQALTVDLASLRTLLMNHIAVESPRGVARKEFIKNLAGNFLIVNNETGEVTGTAPTSQGYQGPPLTEPDIPVQISIDADNGTTYSIKDWFSFSASELHLRMQQVAPSFDSLIKVAGLYTVIDGYLFTSDNDVYTVLAPTRAAIKAAGADLLSGQDLIDFILLHFIVGDFVFTDGNRNNGYYTTARVDESSTIYSKRYTSFYLEPGIDEIHIPDNAGGTYLDITESENANLLTGRLINNAVFNEITTTGVIHLIDRALLVDQLDIREYN